MCTDEQVLLTAKRMWNNNIFFWRIFSDPKNHETCGPQKPVQPLKYCFIGMENTPMGLSYQHQAGSRLALL